MDSLSISVPRDLNNLLMSEARISKRLLCKVPQLRKVFALAVVQKVVMTLGSYGLKDSTRIPFLRCNLKILTGKQVVSLVSAMVGSPQGLMYYKDRRDGKSYESIEAKK